MHLLCLSRHQQQALLSPYPLYPLCHGMAGSIRSRAGDDGASGDLSGGSCCSNHDTRSLPHDRSFLRRRAWEMGHSKMAAV